MIISKVITPGIFNSIPQLRNIGTVFNVSYFEALVDSVVTDEYNSVPSIISVNEDIVYWANHLTGENIYVKDENGDKQLVPFSEEQREEGLNLLKYSMRQVVKKYFDINIKKLDNVLSSEKSIWGIQQLEILKMKIDKKYKSTLLISLAKSKNISIDMLIDKIEYKVSAYNKEIEKLYSNQIAIENNIKEAITITDCLSINIPN